MGNWRRMRGGGGRVIGVVDRKKELLGCKIGEEWAMAGGIAVVRAVIWWAGLALRQEWRHRCPDLLGQLC